MDNKDFNWLTVLLVDDSPAILQYVSTVLERNYNISNVFNATSAAEALQILRQSERINLLFIDLNMPNIDGIQLLNLIQKHGYTGYLVIMSGISTRIISSVELLAKKYQLNYIGTLLKPIDETDFESLFTKIGVSRNQEHSNESLKTYEIIRALKNDDIEVFYQPQVELSTRKFFGLEALCRIHHPRLGIISPDRFIGKAEESELIVHITWVVIKKAIADWQKLHQMGINIELSVNASPTALQQPEFADIIFSLLDQANMPAKNLCIEITENILADNQIQELMNVNRLNMRGVSLALDDFGKENSTVDRLQKLPLTYLKIDKSYFTDLRESIGQLSIISTSISLAHELHLKTIAEGIEDREILKMATEMGCDYGQGYHIGRPMKAKDILPWVKQWRAKT